MTNTHVKLKKSYSNILSMVHALSSGSSWYVPFDEGGVQFVPLSHGNLEIEYGNFFSRNKVKKKIYCGRTIVSRLRELEHTGYVSIIKKRIGRHSVNAYGLTDRGHAYLRLFTGKKASKKPFFYAENPQEKKPVCNPIAEPVSSGKNESFSTALSNKSLNKSYKSGENFSERGVVQGAPPVREKPLVKVLHDHIVATLGDVAAGRLTREVSPWLHQAFKKLGGTLEAFKSFIESLRTRTWLRSQTWFGLKWILKFANMEKILSGGLMDRITQSAPWLKKTPVVVEAVVHVGASEQRDNEVSSYFFRSGEFPSNATLDEIQRFAEKLKRVNLAAYDRVKREFLNGTAAYQGNPT